DADVAHLAIDAVGRIVERAAQHAELGHTGPRRARASRPSTTSADSGPCNDGRSGSGTSSVRRAIPGEWMPGIVVSIRIAAAPNVASLARGPMTTQLTPAIISTTRGDNAVASPTTSTTSIAPRSRLATAEPSCGR